MFKRSSRLSSSSKNEIVVYDSVPVDDQFSSPKQCNYSAVLGKVLLVQNAGSAGYCGVRNSDLSFYTKFKHTYTYGIDADSSYIYTMRDSSSDLVIYRLNFDLSTSVISAELGKNYRMFDAQSDPTYIYITFNNATDGHGVRMVRKSDMTVVASLLATGSGDGQFQDPLGIKYYDGHLYVGDTGNTRIVKIDVVRTPGSESLTFDSNLSIGSNVYDLAFDGTYWYTTSSGNLRKFDASWNLVAGPIASDSYSLCLIPDQGDGHGATLCVVSNANSNIKRHSCATLALITTVGSSGTGADSLCDPAVTGAAGLYITQEDQISAASGAAPTKNGFTGFFYANQPPHVFRFRPTGGKSLRYITAIDMSDDKITSIKNLRKCVNITSLKLQTNVGLSLDLSVLSSKMVTLWAYGCGSGITGSIIHMTALNSVNLRENGASQDQVDQWINDLYANKDVLAAGTANFNGSNAAPSAAAKAKADELVNDYAWSIAYTP